MSTKHTRRRELTPREERAVDAAVNAVLPALREALHRELAAVRADDEVPREVSRVDAAGSA